MVHHVHYPFSYLYHQHSVQPICHRNKSKMETRKGETPKPKPATAVNNNDARLAIMELANLISVPMSLNAVVRLNVADSIWQNGSNTPLTASQILARILPSGDPENLQRILRMLTSYGVFNEHISSSSERRYIIKFDHMFCTFYF